MDTPTIAIVGGGPAGLMAAIAAAAGASSGGGASSRGARIVLFEKMPAPGRKLLLTGNGRCNLTNIADRDAALRRFGPEAARFLRPAFSALSPAQLRDFFDRLDVATCVEDNGRVLPVAGRAAVVLDALLAEVRRCGVEIRTGADVREIVVENGRVAAVAPRTGDPIPCRAVVLAAGGASYPVTGSDGAGARLARAVGHAVTPLRAALVPLLSDDPLPPALQGLALRDARAALWVDGHKTADRDGDVLFTHFGLSGPAALALSGGAVAALDAARRVEIALDLAPHIDDGDLDRQLVQRFAREHRRALQGLLGNFGPQRMAEALVERAGIPADRMAGAVTAAERKRLRMLLKDLRFAIAGHQGLGHAMVTAGGVALSEVAPRTMASRRVAGLFFAGETLDIDGDTGGFNLHAAFATGRFAGIHAAQYLAPSKQPDNPRG